MLRLIPVILFVFLGFFLFPKESLPEPGIPRYEIARIPFNPGDVYYFEFSWNGIKAGEAKANIREELCHFGNLRVDKCYHFRAEAHTTGVVSLLWKMRNSVESWVEKETLKPLTYIFRRREGENKVENVILRFDYSKHIVSYKKERIYTDGSSNVKEKTFNFTEAYDPITASYVLRSINPPDGEDVRFELLVGDKEYLWILEPVGKERVKVGAGEFSAIKLRPIFKKISKHNSPDEGKGKKKKKIKEAYFWISDDEERLPLLMKSKAFIGHVYLELVGMEREGEKSR